MPTFDLLNDPGSYAAESALDTPLPQNSVGADLPQLPSLSDLASGILPTASLPNSNPSLNSMETDANGNPIQYDSSGNAVLWGQPGYDYSALGGTGYPVPMSGPSIPTSGGSGFGSLIGGLIGTAANDAQNIFGVPAIQQAQLPGLIANAQLATAQQAATAQINASSLTTLIVWAAIAYGIILLLKKA